MPVPDFFRIKPRERHNCGVRIIMGEPSTVSPRPTLQSCKSTMKKTGLVLLLTGAAICDAHAEEMSLRNLRFAQMDKPAQANSSPASSPLGSSAQGSSSQANSSGGSCMPIGLTAGGELVFPWDCRAIIERERGPISTDISTLVKNAAKDPAPSAPVAREPVAAAVDRAAAVDDAATKDHASRNADVEHVATIPDTAAAPPAPPPAAMGPLDRRHLLGKRLAVRARTDIKGPRAPIQPPAARPVRESRVPPPG